MISTLNARRGLCINPFATVIVFFVDFYNNCSLSGYRLIVASLIGIWAPLPFQMKIKNFSKRYFLSTVGSERINKYIFE